MTSTACVELDQRLGGVTVHRVADARRPDRPAVGVELEVAIRRLAVVGAYGGVYGGLRPGPELLTGSEVERREASPSAIDPPEPGRGQDRLQRRRVVPPDHLSGGAVDQNQVLVR